ncbi:MAG: hypothetical protein PT957_00070 [Firmicutes bacterium]|nr:hypothetical protein [Bacillota bacterium]
MASIFGIINKYKGQLNLLPILILIFVAATILVYVFFNREPKFKYFPALVGILGGLILIWMGSMNFTTDNGLRWVWYGVATFVAGCVGLGTAWLLALFTSMPGMGNFSKKTRRSAGKTGPKPRTAKKPANRPTTRSAAKGRHRGDE